jgi:hypothetical protein
MTALQKEVGFFSYIAWNRNERGGDLKAITETISTRVRNL